MGRCLYATKGPKERPFASVMPGSGLRAHLWLLGLYPSLQTADTLNTYVASERQAIRFIERWASAHWDRIGRPMPPPGKAWLVEGRPPGVIAVRRRDDV